MLTEIRNMKLFVTKYLSFKRKSLKSASRLLARKLCPVACRRLIWLKMKDPYRTRGQTLDTEKSVIIEIVSGILRKIARFSLSVLKRILFCLNSRNSMLPCSFEKLCCIPMFHTSLWKVRQLFQGRKLKQHSDSHPRLNLA